MKLKRELMQATQSLVLLGMALAVGFNSAMHFMDVREARDEALRPPIEKLIFKTNEQNDIQGNPTNFNHSDHKKSAKQTKYPFKRLSRKDILEFIVKAVPAWIAFMGFYFLINRLINKLMSSR